MGSKVCISKTLIYLIFLTVVVSTFLYVVGRINRQELTTQSQASMSVFMNNQTCSTKTGDQSAICVKKFSNKVICGKNKKRSYGISIDGTNTNLGNFDCDSSVFREGRCCTSDQYIIPTLTRSERSKLTQPSPKLRKAKGRGITSSGICSDGQFVTKCIFGSKDYSSGPAVCPNNPPKHETVEGCKPPDARRCGEYDIDQCVASQSRCYWDSTKEGCLEN